MNFNFFHKKSSFKENNERYFEKNGYKNLAATCLVAAVFISLLHRWTIKNPQSAPSIWNNPEAHQAHQQHGAHARNESNRYDQNTHIQSVLQRCGGSQGGVYAAVWFWLQKSLLHAERLHVQGVGLVFFVCN